MKKRSRTEALTGLPLQDGTVEDSRFIKQLKKGDKEGINSLFDNYYDRAYGYCYRRVTHREAAQDITQEVFLRVFKHIEDYRHYGKFENYLYVVAGNLCKDFYKKKKFYPLDDLELQAEGEEFIKLEQAIVVKEALDKLPELEREIIYLRFYQDRKIKDISKILDLKLSTVKYHLKRAQELLTEYLSVIHE